MDFSRSKLFATAVLTMLVFATPGVAGPDDNDIMDKDRYGSGSGRMMDKMGDRMGDRMRERMRGRMMGDCPGWMMDRRGMGGGMMGGGYGQHSWMMRRFGSGMGPGMMYGYGGDEAEGELNLTVDRVKNYLSRMIRNPNLTVGDVREKNKDTIVAEIVTKRGDVLVQRLEFNRHTGFVRPQRDMGTTGENPEEPDDENDDDSR